MTKVLLLHWWQVAKGRHFMCNMMKVDIANFIARPSNRGEMALYWVTREEASTVPQPRKLWKLSPGLWRDIHWFISCLKGKLWTWHTVFRHLRNCLVCLTRRQKGSFG
jgi:hypothetical protein